MLPLLCECLAQLAQPALCAHQEGQALAEMEGVSSEIALLSS